MLHSFHQYSTHSYLLYYEKKKQVALDGNSFKWYMRGVRFDSQLDKRLPRPKFFVIFLILQSIADKRLKAGHEHLLAVLSSLTNTIMHSYVSTLNKRFSCCSVVKYRTLRPSRRSISFKNWAKLFKRV
jgi:hypothetical protein